MGVSFGIGAAAKSQYRGANCPNNVCVTPGDGTEKTRLLPRRRSQLSSSAWAPQRLLEAACFGSRRHRTSELPASATARRVRVGITLEIVLEEHSE